MAARFVRSHTGITKFSSTTHTQAMPSLGGVAAGLTLYLAVAFDNSTATTPTITSISKETGETNDWSELVIADSSSASAAAGVRVALWTIKTTVNWLDGGEITFSAARVAKASALLVFAGGTGTIRGTAGTGTSTTSTPSASTSGTALVAGDLVLGVAAFENSGAITGDTDTTNGSWSALVSATTIGGNAASNVRVGIQWKVVTATGVQTYNPTHGTSTDSSAAIVAVQTDGVFTPIDMREEFHSGAVTDQVTTSNTAFDEYSGTHPLTLNADTNTGYGLCIGSNNPGSQRGRYNWTSDHTIKFVTEFLFRPVANVAALTTVPATALYSWTGLTDDYWDLVFLRYFGATSGAPDEGKIAVEDWWNGGILRVTTTDALELGAWHRIRWYLDFEDQASVATGLTLWKGRTLWSNDTADAWFHGTNTFDTTSKIMPPIWAFSYGYNAATEAHEYYWDNIRLLTETTTITADTPQTAGFGVQL